MKNQRDYLIFEDALQDSTHIPRHIVKTSL
jgi:hypothetical protein